MIGWLKCLLGNHDYGYHITTSSVLVCKRCGKLHIVGTPVKK